MRLITPPTPSQRDSDIYQAFITTNRTQAEVAKEFAISQPRVSQIVTRVRRWLAKGVRWDDHVLPLAHRRYVALHETRLRLESDYLWERKLVEQMAGPQIDVSHRKRDGVLIETEKHSKFGKVSASHFKELRQHRLSILDVELQETEAKESVMKANNESELWLEDCLANKVHRYVKTLCKLHAKMVAIGAKVSPLPEIDWEEIERTLRANHRDGRRSQTAINVLLPPAWRQIADEVLFEPEPLRDPEPVAEPTPTTYTPPPSSPPPQYEPYVPQTNFPEIDFHQRASYAPPAPAEALYESDDNSAEEETNPLAVSDEKPTQSRTSVAAKCVNHSLPMPQRSAYKTFAEYHQAMLRRNPFFQPILHIKREYPPQK